MSTRLTANDAMTSLAAHVADKGGEIRQRYGPRLGWKELQAMLQDPACVRYPCEILFDTLGLEPGEMAHPVCRGERPEDGFSIYVHPVFMTQLERVPHLVLYQLVLVNYGDFASADDAEVFGSAALGISREDYYQTLCELSDQLGCATG